MIHCYKLNGYNIVLDLASGSVHSVDDVAYDAISMYEDKSKEEIADFLLEKYKDIPDVTPSEINELFKDIETLISAGKLFSKDVYENHAFDFKARHTEVKALCLHIAHSCNLTCNYCFAAQGNFHGKSALMSLDVGKRAIDFLIENSGKRKNLEVDFFGGEPLLNFGVVKEIVAYARSIEKQHNKNFRFTLTTNGMLIDDDVIDFANRECHNVVLSLDGRKEIHDALRKTPSGKGSYDTIVPKFKKLVESRGGTGYYMRGTFTHRNPDFTNDVFHMADLGFSELSMEPVVCAPDDPNGLTDEDIKIVCDQYEILAKEMIRRKKTGNSFTFYHYMIDLTGGPCIYKRIAGCGSGTEYFAVTPWGELYPCHQFVGDEKYKMGDIWKGITKEEVRDEFKLCNAYAKPECKDCWAKLYCSGGCAANAYHASGKITGIYEQGCTLFKKRIECAVMIKVAESE